MPSNRYQDDWTAAVRGMVSMVTNGSGGSGDPVDRLLGEAVAASDRRIAELQEQLIEARVQYELKRRAELPKRSKMTPAQKSQYIRTHGVEAYNKLDWE